MIPDLTTLPTTVHRHTDSSGATTDFTLALGVAAPGSTEWIPLGFGRRVRRNLAGAE